MPYANVRFHIVTGTYDRVPIITPEVEPILYTALCRKARDAGGQVSQVGGVADHVHLIARLPRTMSIARFMSVLKSGSCLAVRTRFGEDAFRWQEGYGITSLNPHRMEEIRAYVRHQKAHHEARTVWPLYERIAVG
jgi:REP element-mobilizing transposase RayT